MPPFDTSPRCPRCQYDLTGLPEIHTCPECCFAYDPHAIYLRLKVRRAIWNQIFMGLVLISASLYFAGSRITPKENMPLIATIILAMILGILQLLVSHGRVSLTLNRFGVTISDEREEDTRTSWNDIQDVRFSWITGTIVIRSNLPKRLVIAYLQVGGFFKARRLAREIRRLKNVYATQAPSTASIGSK